MTAHAEDEYKSYHDNRAFQFHNNNTLGRKKAVGSISDSKTTKQASQVDQTTVVGDKLNVVIIHEISKKPRQEDADFKVDQVCACTSQQNNIKAGGETRKRHNATQTPTSLINWEKRPYYHSNNLLQCHCEYICLRRSPASCYCPNAQEQVCHCHRLPNSTSHYCRYKCQHHHRHSGRSRSTDHKHHEGQGPPMGIKECPMRRKHNKCWSENRSRYGPMKQQAHNLHCSSMEHLPNIYTKSSESSDDPHNHPNHHLSSSTALQEIAIEIDAATMTEDNSTTATSNFAFKVAADNAVVPIIRAPIHADSDEESRGVIRHMKRRSSINSNTTAETDEFSNEEAEENQPQGDYRCQCVYWHSYESGQKFLASAVAEPKNECVKIKRKRFIAADDCCSSCSRCSSCSCSHVHTSSCSSFEEWPGITSNTQSFTVSADCHRCATKRHSAVSSFDYTGNNDNPFISDEVLPQPLIQDTTDSSAPTSRRSSITTSFCSCTSNAPCCCGEDSATGQMCTAQDATIRTSSIGKVACLDVDEQHSSTLTPLTNPSSAVSTPVGEEGDVTMRSISQPLTDDTSSHSHSADYYSLSSSQPHSQTTPNKTPRHAVILQKSTEVARVDVAGETFDGEDHDKKSRKPCKHFGKHHRHKRSESPTDSYL